MTKLVAMALIAVAACGGAAAPAAEQAAQQTAIPTNTPGATATPRPTKAPLTGDAVAAAVRAGPFGVTEVTVYTAETDTNKLLGRPGQYIAKASWKEPRAASSTDLATIEVFPDLASLQTRYTYIDAIIKSSPLFLQWMYRNDERLALLRLPKDLTPDQAKQYEDWLKTL
jgi:hypothetical protein